MNPDMRSLDHLAQGYFHEDFTLESAEPLYMVTMFRHGEPPVVVDELLAAVQALLRSATEAQMREQWLTRSHASYDPSAHGMTYREWFERVLEVLREPR